MEELLAQPATSAEPTENQRTFRLSTTFLRHLLGSSPQAMRAVMEANRDPEEEQDATPWWHVEVEGNPVGRNLLYGGEFGTVGRASELHDLRIGGKRKRAASRPEDRCDVRRSMVRRQRASIGTTWPGRRRLEIGQETVPNSPGTVVAEYPSIPYIGQYSHDFETFCECYTGPTDGRHGHAELPTTLVLYERHPLSSSPWSSRPRVASFPSRFTQNGSRR